MLDPNKLTLGEVAFIEKTSGQSMAEFGDAGKPQSQLLTALYTVARRRAGEPGYSLAQATSVPLDEAMDYLGLSEEDGPAGQGDAVDPTPAAGPTPPPAKPAKTTGRSKTA